MIATYLLTGGRRNEVFGLLVGDIDFENDLVSIQPNQRRRLKRVWSERAVPLWPQLEEILGLYVKGLDRSGDELLFPRQTGEMITDLRKPLGIIAAEAGMPEPRLTKFRHTYATARLQTGARKQRSENKGHATARDNVRWCTRSVDMRSHASVQAGADS